MMRSVLAISFLSVMAFGCAGQGLPVYEPSVLGIWRGDSAGDLFRFGQWPSQESDVNLLLLSDERGNFFSWEGNLQAHSSCGDTACDCFGSSDDFFGNRRHEGLWEFNESDANERSGQLILYDDPAVGFSQVCDDDTDIGQDKQFANSTFSYTASVIDAGGGREEMILDLQEILLDDGAPYAIENNTTYSFRLVSEALN